MPKRSRSRSVSRGRPTRRARGSYALSAARAMRPRPRLNRVRAQGTHNFSRHCAQQELTINGTHLSRMYEIMFSDMIQSSDFTTLFDMYRITKVTYRFQLVNVPEAYLYINSANTSAAVNANNFYPKVWYVTDYDGGATETLNSIRERQGVKCRILRPNKEIRISFVPKCRVLTYKTAGAEGYAPRNIKIDMNDTDVPHYGLACVFDTNGYDPNDTYPFKVVVERKLTFQCFGVR